MTQSPEVARRRIATPAGAPGSGRLRYAAAMTLWQSGEISTAALEVYRMLAHLDAEDPAAALSAACEIVPAHELPDPAEALRDLLDACDGYVRGLTAPSVPEIRRALAAARAADVVPATAETTPAARNILGAYLGEALDIVSTEGRPDLSEAIAAATPWMPWVTYELYDPNLIGADFLNGHVYAELVGPGAPFDAADFSFGIFLIAPHVLYRDHRHPAPELYMPLTGPHGWRFGPDTPVVIKPAHQPVWNAPMAPHMTKVGPNPFLCLYGWTGNVMLPATVIPARDWPALEALRLEP